MPITYEKIEALFEEKFQEALKPTDKFGKASKV